MAGVAFGQTSGPLSEPRNQEDPKFPILFVDISNSEVPVPLTIFDPMQVSDPGSEFGAGEVAVAPVLNPLGPGVRYILLTAGSSNKDVRLYRSLPTEQDGSTNLKSMNLRWEFIGSWNRGTVTDTGENDWPCCGSQSFLMFNFVRQEGMNGSLFLIGARNDEPTNIFPSGGRIGPPAK